MEPRLNSAGVFVRIILMLFLYKPKASCCNGHYQYDAYDDYAACRDGSIGGIFVMMVMIFLRGIWLIIWDYRNNSRGVRGSFVEVMFVFITFNGERDRYIVFAIRSFERVLMGGGILRCVWNCGLCGV